MSSERSFKNWLQNKIGSNEQDDSLVEYIISILNDEETSDDDKKESILVFIQELNPDKSDDCLRNMIDQVIDQFKSSNTSTITSESSLALSQSYEDPIGKILELTRKHKEQVVEVKKVEEKETNASDYVYYSHLPGNSDDDEDNSHDHTKSLDLEANTNAQSVLEKEKKQREQLHESHLKQQERNKKDQQLQKEREEERKKKAKQKASKVERKR